MAVRHTGAIPKQQPAGRPVATPQAPVVHLPPIEAGTLTGVEPLMIASLPSLASGADVYSRQFYRGHQVPFRRYLPIGVR